MNGTRFAHRGIEIFIGSEAIIGDYVVIWARVIIGRESECGLTPTIADDKYIGDAAKMLSWRSGKGLELAQRHILDHVRASALTVGVTRVVWMEYAQ